MTVLTDAGRAARRAYKKSWDEAHKEHNKIYQANYWNAKAEKLKAAADKEKILSKNNKKAKLNFEQAINRKRCNK